MKKIFALHAALALTIAIPTLAFTQTRGPQSHSAKIPISYILNASNAIEPPMSFETVRTITEGAIRSSVNSELQGITTDEVSGKLADRFQDITSGKIVNISCPLGKRTERSITEQYSMNIRINYERRPIGGILTVEVELVPALSGIGSSSRPIAREESAEAVDNFDSDSLANIVTAIAHHLGAKYAEQ